MAFLLFEREELMQNIDLILSLRYFALINDMTLFINAQEKTYQKAIIKYFKVLSLIIISG